MENPEPVPPKTYTAELGMQVVLDLVMEDGNEQLELEIVPDDFADFSRGYLGISTPLARTILGKKAGEVVPYPVEGGREVHLIQVSPSHKAPPQDVADRRQEVLRKALDQSDRTNAVIFASSFSGKWGDYDPTGFTDEQDKKEA